LKNLIDWLSRPVSENEPQVLAGKPAAISGISLGMSGTAIAQDHLVTLISFFGHESYERSKGYVPNAWQYVDDQGKLIMESIYPHLEKQAKAFVNFIQAKCL